MKKVISKIFKIASLCGCLFVLGCEKSDKKIEVGVCCDSPPFAMMDKGEAIGFEVALAKEIAKILKKEALIKDMSFSALIPAIQAKRIDFALSLIEATPERTQNTDLSIPYYKAKRVALMKDAPSENRPLLQIVGENKKIGVQLGSTHHHYMEELSKTMPQWSSEIRVYDAVGQMLEDVKNGRLDMMVIDKPTADIFIKEKNVYGTEFPAVDSEGYVIVLAKNSNLTQLVNQAIKTLEKNGTLKKLRQRWLGEKK